MQEAAPLGQRHGGDGVRPALGGQRGAFQRINRDIHRRAATADLLADEQHRGLIHLALADHHGAVDLHGIEGLPHRLHRGAIGLVLLAQTNPARRRQRRRLGHPYQLHRQVTVGDRQFGGGQCGAHGASSPDRGSVMNHRLADFPRRSITAHRSPLD